MDPAYEVIDWSPWIDYDFHYSKRDTIKLDVDSADLTSEEFIRWYIEMYRMGMEIDELMEWTNVKLENDDYNDFNELVKDCEFNNDYALIKDEYFQICTIIEFESKNKEPKFISKDDEVYYITWDTYLHEYEGEKINFYCDTKKDHFPIVLYYVAGGFDLSDDVLKLISDYDPKINIKDINQLRYSKCLVSLVQHHSHIFGKKCYFRVEYIPNCLRKYHYVDTTGVNEILVLEEHLYDPDAGAGTGAGAGAGAGSGASAGAGAGAGAGASAGAKKD